MKRERKLRVGIEFWTRKNTRPFAGVWLGGCMIKALVALDNSISKMDLMPGMTRFLYARV